MKNSLNNCESPQELAKRIHLPIQDTLLLSRALTHRSYLNEQPDGLEDNERLEFLGDAVIDFIVSAWLYDSFPEMAEGSLTRIRSAIVRTEKLGEIAKTMDIGAALKLGKGESESGGRERPTLLCATLEAIIGALFIDSGLDAVKQWILPLLPEITTHILEDGKDQDSKSMLQEWAQSQGFGSPRYRTRFTSGPDHAKVFEVEVLVNNNVQGTGTGTSKQAAAKEAAIAALSALGFVNGSSGKE